MIKSARYWIDKLNLIAHPEGGYYRETYRAELSIAGEALPPQLPGRGWFRRQSISCSTERIFPPSIACGRMSFWHFYSGSPIAVHVIGPDGSYSEIQVGSDPDAGEVLQAVVKAGHWFASRVRDPETFALAGCTVAPGFDFADFELGKRAELVRLYPQHRSLIESLTRD